MTNLWYKIFPKWEDYRIFRGVWKGKNVDEMGEWNGEWLKHCRFHIQYSRKLKRYRIRTFGYRPKDHPRYDEVLQELHELNGKR